MLANAGVWTAIAMRSDTTTIFSPSFTVMTPPAPEPPAPIVVAPVAHAPSCPPARTDAPFVAPKFVEDIDHLQPAPSNAGWIAAWNDHHVFVSRDAGATFERVLDGSGKVYSASFDCFGHVIVARGSELGIRDGKDEQWKPLPAVQDDDSARAVIGGGPDVVVVGTGPKEGDVMRAAISSDGGATWRYHDLSSQSGTPAGDKIRGREYENGTIDIAYSIADCMDDEIFSAHIANGQVSVDSYGGPEGTDFAFVDDVLLTSGGWHARGGEWQAYPENHWVGVIAESNVIVDGGKASRFAHGKLRDLPVVVEGKPQAVDPAGRIWSIACGQPLVAKRTPTGIPARCESSD